MGSSCTCTYTTGQVFQFNFWHMYPGSRLTHVLMAPWGCFKLCCFYAGSSFCHSSHCLSQKTHFKWHLLIFLPPQNRVQLGTLFGIPLTYIYVYIHTHTHTHKFYKQNHSDSVFYFYFTFEDFIWILLERGEGKEKERETSMCSCVSHAP